MDLQKSKVTAVKLNTGNKRSKSVVKQSKCQYHAKDKFEDLKNEIITDIVDIEDLVKLGQEMKVCPYYSSKLGIEHAHVILLPYQMLLNNKIRSQFNLNLKNNIVIIDEAHNLLDTLSDMHSASVTLSQLEICVSQLKLYLDKYINRMKSTNIVLFKRLIFVVQRLQKMLDKHVKSEKQSRMLSLIDLMYESEFANINVYEIIKFCDETRLPDKVHSFAKNYKAPLIESNKSSESATSKLLKNLENVSKKGKKKSKDDENVNDADNKIDERKSVIPSVIRPVLRFLECLTDKSDTGRVLIFKENCDNSVKCRMKYMILKPNEHFKSILNDCRSVSLFYKYDIFLGNENILICSSFLREEQCNRHQKL